MAATDEMIAIAQEVRPHTAMLVPEGRAEITTEGGLDVAGQTGPPAAAGGASWPTPGWWSAPSSTPIRARSRPPPRAASRICEVHTGPVRPRLLRARPRRRRSRRASGSWRRSARRASSSGAAGMRFNAGHALNYYNVQPVATLAGVRELHIGHSIVARAVLVGMREAVREMKRLHPRGRRGASRAPGPDERRISTRPQ